MSDTSSTDLTSRQPGGRPDRLGYRQPGIADHTNCGRPDVNSGPPGGESPPLPCCAGVRFLSALKGGISTEEPRRPDAMVERDIAHRPCRQLPSPLGVLVPSEGVRAGLGAGGDADEAELSADHVPRFAFLIDPDPQRSLTGNRQAWSSAERELMPH